MQNIAVIGIGSNINPYENIEKLFPLLDKLGNVEKKSAFTETEPLLFTDQSKFVNGAVLFVTDLSFENLNKSLKKIEVKLGRIKTENKNGPRTIDLDIVVFNGNITDNDLYVREFLKNSVKELLPEIPI